MAKPLKLLNCCTPLARPTLSDAEAVELERLFRVLADRTRVKILNLLSGAGDEAICVCELVPALGLAQPTVSHHLKQLTDAGLLEREKRGTFAYYRLVPGALERLGALLAQPRELAAAS
jgi:ArsR family transcriptional regulator, arsenate/arsenite/antimonite-responsive transcriptional repressor